MRTAYHEQLEGLTNRLGEMCGLAGVAMERATQAREEAGKPVNPELLQYLSPLGWEHINLTGDYVWRQSRKLEDGKFRPLRQVGKP